MPEYVCRYTKQCRYGMIHEDLIEHRFDGDSHITVCMGHRFSCVLWLTLFPFFLMACRPWARPLLGPLTGKAIRTYDEALMTATLITMMKELSLFVNIFCDFVNGFLVLVCMAWLMRSWFYTIWAVSTLVLIMQELPRDIWFLGSKFISR